MVFLDGCALLRERRRERVRRRPLQQAVPAAATLRQERFSTVPSLSAVLRGVLGELERDEDVDHGGPHRIDDLLIKPGVSSSLPQTLHEQTAPVRATDFNRVALERGRTLDELLSMSQEIDQLIVDRVDLCPKRDQRHATEP
ncbi:MAG TPA: hypothetical protein VNS09_21085 [Solirubrobacter sp.]|nr:hypothetical protein [Solirubrobacter sp.]